MFRQELDNYFSEQQREKEVSVDRWFDINELCAYLPDKPAKATVYGRVSRNELPYRKGGKHLRFLKSEIDAHLMRNVKGCYSKEDSEVDALLSSYQDKRKKLKL